MSKMSSHDRFEYLKHKLWPNERVKTFPTLKVRKRHDLFACRWHATYRWKVVDKGYNVSSNLTSIGG